MDDCFAFFVVLRQGPGRDPLHVTSPKSRPAIRVENPARAGLVENRPNFETFAKFPTAAVQNRFAARQSGSLSLIFGALGKEVDRFLTTHFEADCFKRSVH